MPPTTPKATAPNPTPDPDLPVAADPIAEPVATPPDPAQMQGVAGALPPQVVAEATAQRDAQIAEYSQWVATSPIDINGARAFNAGDPVPASHVDRGVVGRDLVEPARGTNGSAVTDGEV